MNMIALSNKRIQMEGRLLCKREVYRYRAKLLLAYCMPYFSVIHPHSFSIPIAEKALAALLRRRHPAQFVT